MKTPELTPLASNFTRLDMPDGSCLWFSYRTLIAFMKHGNPVTAVDNYWGSTTGKHINQVTPDKSKRLKKDAFDAAYAAAFPAE